MLKGRQAKRSDKYTVRKFRSDQDSQGSRGEPSFSPLSVKSRHLIDLGLTNPLTFFLRQIYMKLGNNQDMIAALRGALDELCDTYLFCATFPAPMNAEVASKETIRSLAAQISGVTQCSYR